MSPEVEWQVVVVVDAPANGLIRPVRLFTPLVAWCAFELAPRLPLPSGPRKPRVLRPVWRRRWRSRGSSATDQAAAAELDALTAPLRTRLAGLPNYTRPGRARDRSVPGFTPDSDLHRAVLSAFDALVAGLRAALEAIRGPNATNPRVVLDLACLSVLLRQGRSVHVTAAEAGPTVLRLFACALADALASLPPRDLVARGRITDAQPLFLVLDGFEDYAVPGLLPTELAKRGIALTVGLSSLGRLSQASESLARDLWSNTDIHVADRAALEERALAVAIETDLAMNATREHIEAVPALLEPRDAQFL